MNYLISGGAGFIGSHLTESLLNNDHKVTVIDNFSTSAPENLNQVNGDLSVYNADITGPLPVNGPFDIIIHLASIPTPDKYMSRPVQTLTTGSVGTRQTLELAKENNAIYLLASTSEVYGNPNTHPQPESYNGDVNPFGPRSSYDESKRFAEAACRAYRDKYNVNIRVARIFNTYGPRMRDSRVVPSFIRRALQGEDLIIHGDGAQTRCFCYISDLIQGLRALIKRGAPTPTNLGNPDEISISKLAEEVLQITNSDAGIIYEERPPDDPQRRQPDIQKARRELNWEPQINLQDGLRRTIRYYKGD